MDYRTGSYTAFQEGAKRYASAMNGIPDRIPVYAQMHQFVRKGLGVSAKRFYSTPEILVKGTLETRTTYGIDVPLIDYDAAVGGHNGRFALYLCNLDAGTPPGNIKAVVEALNTI